MKLVYFLLTLTIPLIFAFSRRRLDKYNLLGYFISIWLGAIFMFSSIDAKFVILSKDFKNNKTMPANLVEKNGVFPELNWKNAPKKTKSFALIIDDPDAPMDTPFVHGGFFNIPASYTSLAQGFGNQENLPDSIKGIVNSAGKTKYYPPTPPPGKVHHYHFKLYALDSFLSLETGITKDDLLAAMKNHILASATLTGLHQKGTKVLKS